MHLTYTNAPDFKRSILFRNYLRKYPEESKKYSDIKRHASEKANQAKTREEAKKIYMDVKRNTIQEIIVRAFQEADIERSRSA